MTTRGAAGALILRLSRRRMRVRVHRKVAPCPSVPGTHGTPSTEVLLISVLAQLCI